MTYQWLTTSPNPRVRGYGTDDGQRGWRTHAVQAADGDTFEQVKHLAAACGQRARHGWGMDMFIELKCAKCVRALTKVTGVNPETGREQAIRRILSQEAKS